MQPVSRASGGLPLVARRRARARQPARRRHGLLRGHARRSAATRCRRRVSRSTRRSPSARRSSRFSRRSGSSSRGGRSTCCSRAGFLAAGLGTLAFGVAPVLGGGELTPVESWAGIGAQLWGGALVAAAPFVPWRIASRPQVLAVAGVDDRARRSSGSAGGRACRRPRHEIQPGSVRSFPLTLAYAALALVRRRRRHRLRPSLPRARAGSRQLARRSRSR